MNTTVFLSLFSLLGIFYLWLGLRASQDINSNEDYFLAGRMLPWRFCRVNMALS